MHINRSLLLTFLLATLLPGCSATTFTSTWKPLEVNSLDFTGKKTVALFLSREVSDRRTAEDTLVEVIAAWGGAGVPAYTLLAENEISDLDETKSAFFRARIDVAVIMRVIGREKQLTQTPGSWRRAPFGISMGYNHPGVYGVYEPGYLKEDTIVSVETIIYDISQDKLLWAGVSRTINPTRMEPFIRELAAEAAKEMQKQGLVAQ